MIDDYKLDKVLDKIKNIGIDKLDEIRILIDADEKIPHNMTLKSSLRPFNL